MNWAGYDASSAARPRHGVPNCANGIEPESYQTSITSGTRRASPSHVGHLNVTESTYGRCGSSPVRSAPASADSSTSEPTQVRCDSGHSHRGSGVPQYRVRDSAQSTLFRSHSPYRPYLTVAGYQLVRSFSSSSLPLIAVVLMYHEGTA